MQHDFLVFQILLQNNFNTKYINFLILKKSVMIQDKCKEQATFLKNRFSKQEEQLNSLNFHNDRLFSQYINTQPILQNTAPPAQSDVFDLQSMQTQTLVICTDTSNFDTFNQGYRDLNNLCKNQESSQQKKRFRLWSSGSNHQTQLSRSESQTKLIKKGSLTMAMRKPLVNIKNIKSSIKNSQSKSKLQITNSSKIDNNKNKYTNAENPKITQPIAFLSTISQEDKKCCHKVSIQNSSTCTCQQFDKLLQITSRCVDYYNSFVKQKDEQITIVRQAFKQISASMSTAFNNIIQQIKSKHEQILRFLVKKQQQLCEVKQKQEQNLKISLQDIQSVHLTNFLFRDQDKIGCHKKPRSGQQQISQNSQTIECCGDKSGQINNYAKTLHNFYEAMEQIQKCSFKQNVDETINFINNLITEEIKFIVFEKIPQKSINCSFSFNNSFEEAKNLLSNRSNNLKLKMQGQSNNLSLSSQSIGTCLYLSSVNSPDERHKKKSQTILNIDAQRCVGRCEMGIQTVKQQWQTSVVVEIRNIQKERQQKYKGYLALMGSNMQLHTHTGVQLHKMKSTKLLKTSNNSSNSSSSNNNSKSNSNSNSNNNRLRMYTQ